MLGVAQLGGTLGTLRDVDSIGFQSVTVLVPTLKSGSQRHSVHS